VYICVCVWVGESEHLSKLENLWALLNASITLFCLCLRWLDLFMWMCVSLRTLPPSDELFSYSQYTHQAHTDKPKHSHYNQMCVIWVCVCRPAGFSLFLSFFKTNQEEFNFLAFGKITPFPEKQQNPLSALAFTLRHTNMHRYIYSLLQQWVFSLKKHKTAFLVKLPIMHQCLSISVIW